MKQGCSMCARGHLLNVCASSLYAPPQKKYQDNAPNSHRMCTLLYLEMWIGIEDTTLNYSRALIDN